MHVDSLWIRPICNGAAKRRLPAPEGVAQRTAHGTHFLQYSFTESVAAMHPFYVTRALGGILFLSGGLIMAYNLWRTIRGDIRVEDEALEAPPTLAAAE